MTKDFNVIGVMSGSSLDGIDIAFCRFYEKNNSWGYSIELADTINYSDEWKTFLIDTSNVSIEEFLSRNVKYGKFLGDVINGFIKKYNIKVDLIGLHGHTIFHNPEKGFSVQLGSGQAVAVATGIPTVSDFRTKDILLGGQGAPLVPIGDALLFSEYDYCVNIGGIANVSFEEGNSRKAFDICPANQLLNYLSLKKNFPYDKGGNLSRKGKFNDTLFKILNNDKYYKLPIPKSLSNEYVKETFIPILDKFDIPVEDKLNTVVKHIAYQIGNSITSKSNGKNILITGGGAHNSYLIESVREMTKLEVIIPEKQIADFKEALIFAFMGLLRKLDKKNCLAAATGAEKNSSTGNIFYP